MKFEIYQDRRGEWRWRIKGRNGKVIADSAESFTRRYHAVRNARTLFRPMDFPK